MVIECLIRGTAFFLALIGLSIALGAGEPLRVLREPDVLFGLSNRSTLVLAGVVHLVIGVCVAATRTPNMQALVLLWFGLNHLVYRLGLGWMEVREPPVLRALSLRLGIRPETLDAGWKWFIGYLIVGSALVLLLEWRRQKQRETEAFMEEYRRRRRHDV